MRLGVQTAPPHEAVALPESAIREDEDPPTILIVESLKKTEKKDHKAEETGVARRVAVELGIRDRKHHLVEVVRVVDAKAEDKAPTIDLTKVPFILDGGQGIQSGDAVKLEADDE
jgi:hypothetical protein